MTDNDFQRRQTILDAALQVFMREGFYRASIKQIAQQAQLKSPSLIYWYFQDKWELFQAVLSSLSPFVQVINDPPLVLDLPLYRVLTMFMKTYYTMLDHPQGGPLIRWLLAESFQNPNVAERYSANQRQALDFLSDYLQNQMEQGRLRSHDPQVIARAFLGAMFSYVLTHELLPHLQESRLVARSVYIREIVLTFSHGLCLIPQEVSDAEHYSYE
jgi:AcrR family transcriptional regulator